MVIQTTLGPKLASLIRLAQSVRHIYGDVAECGVFQGGALRDLAIALPEKRILGFDTFTGLPAAAWSEGEPHSIGDFANTSFDLVTQHTADLQNVQLVRGTFPESCGPFINDMFVFVYIDFDFYVSTLAAIDWFQPRMVHGGLIVFDDYDWQYCPGVKRAIEERNLLIESPCAYQAICRI